MKKKKYKKWGFIKERNKKSYTKRNKNKIDAGK